MKRSRSGYTLTEVMIVVTIVGVLATLAIPILAGHVSRTYNNEALEQIAQIRGSLSEHRSVNGSYANAVLGPPVLPTDISLSYNPAVTAGQTPNWTYGLGGLGVNTYTITATRNALQGNGNAMPNAGCTITITEAGARGGTCPG